jgi:hypothetical protein
MAGEKKGKAYEAITKAALVVLQSKKAFKGEIFWDEKPEGMTIIPDLTIGPDKDNPHTVILVTHCGSAKESEKKGWRNMGELLETKVFLPSVPKVFNLAFDSVIKENLKTAQAASFDGQLLVGDLAYGNDLQKWIDDNVGSLPKDKHEKVDFIVDAAKSDKVLARLMSLFSSDLEALLKKTAPPELDQVWAMERKRTPGRAPRARDTFVRRGLSKLLIFEDVDVALRLFSGKRVGVDEVPEYAYELGLATKAVGRANPADEEIANAVNLLSVEGIRRVVKDAPVNKMERWIDPLRNLSQVKSIYKYICDNTAELRTPRGMLAALQAVNAAPSDVLKGLVTLETNWLYFSLIDLLNAGAKKGQAFGYAQTLRKIKAMQKEINLFLQSERLDPLVLTGQSFIVRGLTDWLGCIDTPQAKAFSSQFQAAVAFSLSVDFSALSKMPTWEEVKSKCIASNLEQKLVTYRDFQPTRSLILAVAKGKSVKFPSCFGERAGLGVGSTETTVLISANTLINWQSCSDAGRDHKKKELCGRAVALRYSWDTAGKKFIPRPGVKKLILVLDGTWRRDDLLALARAGWDEIFYPDEMDKLAAAIV